MKVTQNQDFSKTSVCMQEYIEKVMEEHGYGTNTKFTTPISTISPFRVQESDSNSRILEDTELTEFQSLVGCIRYLCGMRPDIHYAARRVSQFNAAPQVYHMNLAKRILSSLNNTKNASINFGRGTNLDERLMIYTDALRAPASQVPSAEVAQTITTKDQLLRTICSALTRFSTISAAGLEEAYPNYKQRYTIAIQEKEKKTLTGTYFGQSCKFFLDTAGKPVKYQQETKEQILGISYSQYQNEIQNGNITISVPEDVDMSVQPSGSAQRLEERYNAVMQLYNEMVLQLSGSYFDKWAIRVRFSKFMAPDLQSKDKDKLSNLLELTLRQYALDLQICASPRIAEIVRIFANTCVKGQETCSGSTLPAVMRYICDPSWFGTIPQYQEVLKLRHQFKQHRVADSKVMMDFRNSDVQAFDILVNVMVTDPIAPLTELAYLYLSKFCQILIHEGIKLKDEDEKVVDPLEKGKWPDPVPTTVLEAKERYSILKEKFELYEKDLADKIKARATKAANKTKVKETTTAKLDAVTPVPPAPAKPAASTTTTSTKSVTTPVAKSASKYFCPPKIELNSVESNQTILWGCLPKVELNSVSSDQTLVWGPESVLFDTGSSAMLNGNPELWVSPPKPVPYHKRAVIEHEGHRVMLTHQGSVKLSTLPNGKPIVIDKVWKYDRINRMILSVCELLSSPETGLTFRTVFDGKKWVWVLRTACEQFDFIIYWNNSQMFIDFDNPVNKLKSVKLDGVTSTLEFPYDVLQRYHNANHLSTTAIIRWGRAHCIPGVTPEDLANIDVKKLSCKACARAKITDASHLASLRRLATVPGESLSFDIYGPEHTASREGYYYYAIVVDESSGYRFVLYLQKRSHFYDAFASLYQHIERQTGNSIKRIRSDNAKEFHNLATELVARGVIMERSLPHIHQQNGWAETTIRHLNDQARATMLQRDIPIEFWADAINHSAVLLNALYLPAGSTATAYEKFYGPPYPLSDKYIMREFGSDCVFWLPPPNRKTKENARHKSPKAPHGEAGIYLGHAPIGFTSSTSKAAVVYSTTEHLVRLSHQLKFTDPPTFNNLGDYKRPVTVPHKAPTTVSHNKEFLGSPAAAETLRASITSILKPSGLTVRDPEILEECTEAAPTPDTTTATAPANTETTTAAPANTDTTTTAATATPESPLPMEVEPTPITSTSDATDLLPSTPRGHQATVKRLLLKDAPDNQAFARWALLRDTTWTTDALKQLKHTIANGELDRFLPQQLISQPECSHSEPEYQMEEITVEPPTLSIDQQLDAIIGPTATVEQSDDDEPNLEETRVVTYESSNGQLSLDQQLDAIIGTDSNVEEQQLTIYEPEVTLPIIEEPYSPGHPQSEQRLREAPTTLDVNTWENPTYEPAEFSPTDLYWNSMEPDEPQYIRLDAIKTIQKELTPIGTLLLKPSDICPGGSEEYTLTQARKSEYWPYWQAAIEDEFDSLATNSVAVQVPISTVPVGATLVDSKLVLTLKTNSKGFVERFKGRVCAKGFLQKEGQDYGDITAPVVGIKEVLLLISLSARQKMHIYTIDIKTAFLNAKLDRKIFMRYPTGYKQYENGEKMVLLLQRALYGLKQSPRLWYEELSSFLESLQFEPMVLAPNIMTRGSGYDQVILGIYVDDIMILSKSSEAIQQFIDLLTLEPFNEARKV